MSDITITFAIVVAIVVLFVWNCIPVVLVALGTALALYFTGVLNLAESLGELGDPAVIFIASLFVVSAGLDATGMGGTGIDRTGGAENVRGRWRLRTSAVTNPCSPVQPVGGALALDERRTDAR